MTDCVQQYLPISFPFPFTKRKKISCKETVMSSLKTKLKLLLFLFLGRALFSPRMEYNEWTPVGRGDPLKNDPTFDYSPPVLDRVRYWDSGKEKSNDILLLGVSSKKNPSHRAQNTGPKENSFYSNANSIPMRRNYYMQNVSTSFARKSLILIPAYHGKSPSLLFIPVADNSDAPADAVARTNTRRRDMARSQYCAGSIDRRHDLYQCQGKQWSASQ